VYRLLRPLLFQLDPERAHRLTLATLDAAHSLRLSPLIAPSLAPAPVQVMGLAFPNPVGLAAGLDKNAEHVDALATLGFGFIEVGTVTPRPQAGNPQPRLFRLPAARALINRLGFNNLGVDRLVHNLTRVKYRGVLGINIGKNFDTPIERATGDYVAAMRKAYPLASYLTINISSPNTRDLRQLQGESELPRLLAALKAEQQALAVSHARYVPLAVKIAPDLSDEQVGQVARLLLEYGIDGVIATNTTVSRVGVQGLSFAQEDGGLSGQPLREQATRVIRQLHAALGERIPIIGVGGIMNAQDAKEKLAAGAKLLQLYTGLIYAGPRLVKDCVAALGSLA
jgi:dihydroorotate dehydrogenase